MMETRSGVRHIQDHGLCGCNGRRTDIAFGVEMGRAVVEIYLAATTRLGEEDDRDERQG